MAQRRKITNYNLSPDGILANYNINSKEEKPNSSVYNIYINKNKANNSSNKTPNCNCSSNRQRKIPLYNNPYYSPKKTEKKTNFKLLFPKNRDGKSRKKRGSLEFPSSYIDSTKNEELNTFQNNYTVFPNIYIRKNRMACSPKRSTSENHLKKILKNQIGNSYLTLTSNKSGNSDNKENIRCNLKSDISNNSQINKSYNFININLYNEKKNNIDNKIYINQNKSRKNTSNDKRINTSINSTMINSNESINLTERRFITRRSNYSFYYNKNNVNGNKIQTKGIRIIQKPSKKKINYLPKVQKKLTKRYKLSSIIKIQSVFRGYLLNRKLDKYLRLYDKIKAGIKLIEKKHKRKIINLLKKIRQNKKYNITKNTFLNKIKNNSNHINNEKNIELQIKINELINEKKELQNNYDNLKEFIRKFNELEKQNQELKKEILKLKQKNEELSFQFQYIKNKNSYTNYNFNKYKRCIIQKQTEINIISPKRVDLIYTKYNINKKNDNRSDFFTLGSDGKDNEEIFQTEKNGEIKNNKLKHLLKNKENRNKYLLFKNFIKFYYNCIYNQNNDNNSKNIFNIKSHMSVINKRYINENLNQNPNNIYYCMSIKTLSDNSSILTERKSPKIELDNKTVCNNNLIEEDSKKK